MLFLGVFRIVLSTLLGLVAITLLPSYTSAAAVLKNSCPPNDYLCNHIYQLKLETHGLISALKRKFPDLVNGEQNLDKTGSESEDGLGRTENENNQGREDVTMDSSQMFESISKAPLNNSLNVNTTTERTSDPTDDKSAHTPVTDNVDQEAVTSRTQSNHTIDSATSTSELDPTNTQQKTADTGSTVVTLPDQSITRPMPPSSLDSHDPVTEAAVKVGETSPKHVTSEKVSKAEMVKEGESTSHFTKVDDSKPAPVTLGHVDINGGSRFIDKVTEERATDPLSSLATDTKHESSTQAASMTSQSTTEEGSGQSTTNPLRVMRVSSNEPTPPVDSMDGDTATSLPVSLTNVSADRTSTSGFKGIGTGSTTEVTSRDFTQTEDTTGSGDTILVSPTDVAEYSTTSFSSTATVSERANLTSDFEGNITVVEGKWTAQFNTETVTTAIPATEIVTEEIERGTFSEISSSVNIRDASTRRALEVTRGVEATQSPPASRSSQAIRGTIQSTTSPIKFDFETVVTVLEDESDVILTTSLEDTADTYTSTDKQVTPSEPKFVTTRKMEATETTEKTDAAIEVDELDGTTILYDETDEHISVEQETTSKRDDETTERPVVTDRDPTRAKSDAAEKYISTDIYTEIIDFTTETAPTTPVPTTTVPTTTQEPTTPTPEPPKDCDEIWRRGSRENGIYTVFPTKRPEGFQVYCDLQDKDGGWTVIQRRVNGSVNFFRSWFDYVIGFGTLQREFYLGNEKIHVLTNQKQYELSILLWDFEGESRYARYHRFRLGDYMSSYPLSVRGYTGNAGNSLGYHSKGRFSTFDRDVDDNPSSNCALMYGSGWWFRDCDVKSNLNGAYLRGENTQRGVGITWKKWKGLEYSLRYSEMRIKPNGL